MFPMKVGLVGLGRMGTAIAPRLTERGCEVPRYFREFMLQVYE
jgi:3-hydroxyisobutyrate dehydrogenase-like beta-hydroxyacid dehydrogenase